jgi:undecaprenyl-diphosphatase
MGEHSGMWFVIAVLGLVFHRHRRGVYLRTMFALMVVEVVNALLKIVIGRKRPTLEGLPPLAWTRSQRSCPSAHASGSFAAARVLSRALPAGPVYACALTMAVSRPYLGVHYPSDIVAGMLLGTLVAEAVAGSADSP